MYKYALLSLSFSLVFAACKSDKQLLNEGDARSVSTRKHGSSPIAFHDSHITFGEKSISFHVPLGKDIDSLKEHLTYKIIKPPSNGLVDDKCFLQTESHSNRGCIYTPDEKFSGIDTLTYQIVDEKNNTSEIARIDFFVTTNIKEQLKTAIIDQSKPKPFDIVWVLDSTESMQAKREELQTSLISFIKQFEDTKGNIPFNFRMLFIKTQIDENIASSKFIRNKEGNFYELTSELAEKDYILFAENFIDSVEQFKKNTDPGRSLASIHQTIINDSSWLNQNNSETYFILLSDKKESSYPNDSFPGKPNYQTIETWFHSITKIKANQDLLKFFPIVDFKVTKTKTSSDLYDRFHQLAQISKGELFDINQPLEETLASIGRNIASSQSNSGYYIDDKDINPKTLEIWINHSKLEPAKWSYRGNTIYFNENVKPGSYLQIKYTRN